MQEFIQKFTDLQPVYRGTEGSDTSVKLWISIQKTKAERDVNALFRLARNRLRQLFPHNRTDICWNSSKLWCYDTDTSPVAKVNRGECTLEWDDDALDRSGMGLTGQQKSSMTLGRSCVESDKNHSHS